MLWAAGSLITCAGPRDETLSWLVSWLVSWSLKEEDSALSREAIKCWSERRQRLEGILLLVVATCGAGWRPAELSSPCRSCSGSARRPNTSQSQPGKQRRYSVFCVLRGRHVSHVWRDSEWRAQYYYGLLIVESFTTKTSFIGSLLKQGIQTICLHLMFVCRDHQLWCAD